MKPGFSFWSLASSPLWLALLSDAALLMFEGFAAWPVWMCILVLSALGLWLSIQLSNAQSRQHQDLRQYLRDQDEMGRT
ncbi:MAG: hypothetical protein JO002_11780, partial [Burkholderiaceae bacterium]|nr:hypothetical protein [Burkholderiaceae bacterium]